MHLFPEVILVVIMSEIGGLGYLLQERTDEVFWSGLAAAARRQLILLDHVGTNIMSLNKTREKKA